MLITTFLLLLVIVFSNLYSTTAIGAGLLCAQLKSHSVNGSFTLKSGNSVGNLADEFLTAEQAWDISAAWTVESSCELKACEGAYFTGNCQRFSGQTSSGEQPWLSAECKCIGVCKCSDLHLNQHVCARAYLESGGGCDECNKLYTELAPGSPSTFPETWNEKVTSFFVRSGCTLNVYEEEDHEGDFETIQGPFLKEWSSTVGSYQCECNNENYIPRAAPTTTSRAIPEMVELPATLDGVIEKFAEKNYSHPGLLVSLMSLAHRRSSKNAYILMIGSSGAGKSSAINLLLGQPNMTAAGESQSTTSQILEFRIPLPLPSLGISNSELRIIDTPGLGDTRGATNDAMFLATLDDYLSEHEELNKHIPNLVLIFHKFPDNRFDGESASFVKMIRGLDNFRTRITDEKYSNVVFVFSHLCSDKKLEKNPLPRLQKFTEVIEKYSLFPKPIMTTVIENKGEDNWLPMKNSNFVLPNGELYPFNLISKFEAVTKKGLDLIGNVIVKAAFTQKLLLENITPKLVTLDLVTSTTHAKVTKYLKILNAAVYSVNNTEVSESLAEAYEEMDSNLKSRFPNCLASLQRFFNIKNIWMKSDVPQTALDILELLAELEVKLERNELVDALLEKGLNLKPPQFSRNTVAGHSYTLMKDMVLPLSPFEMQLSETSSIGFLIPEALHCNKSVPVPNPEYSSKTFDSKDDYYQFRLEKALGKDLSGVVNNSEIFESLTGSMRNGYVVSGDKACKPNDSGSKNKDCSVIVPRMYERFKFKLGSNAKLTPEFIQRVKELQAFNESDHENVEKWTEFFNDYGTHVVSKAVGGGMIEFRFTGPIDTTRENVSAHIKDALMSLEYVENPLFAILKYRRDPKEIIATASTLPHSLVFHGGKQDYHFSDLTDISLEKAFELLKKWRKSVEFYPAVFPQDVSMIGEVVEKYISVDEARKIDEPFKRLLTSTLIHIPPPPPTPDPKVLEELARQQRQAEENLRKLEEARKKAEEEAEKARLAEIEAERKRQEEEQRQAAERERVRKQAEAEAARVERERQHQQYLEQERQKREREEAERRHREHLQWQAEQNRRERERIEAEIRRREEEDRRRRRSSCLKQGTKILLSDFTEKAVETLKIGDILLDKDLRPTKVLGISYEFLLTQSFYGFDNKSFFFTDTHLFVGGEGDNAFGGNRDYDDTSLILYTTSRENLFTQNPLLKYMNVRDFPAESIKLIKFNEKSRTAIKQDVNIFPDPQTYPDDTLIYFIQVDSPSGTYFAEGFVCRHEVPPLEHWPNTLSTLFLLFGTKGMEEIAQLPYTMETIHQIDEISDEVQLAVRKEIQQQFHNFVFVPDNDEITRKEIIKANCPNKVSLSSFDLDEVVGKIFGNPTMAALGMELYGGSGSIIAKYLDNQKVYIDPCKIKMIQERLFGVISNELELSLLNGNA